MLVTLDKDFKIEIPEEIGKSLNLKPGEIFDLIIFDGRIEFIPIKEIADYRGFLKGINTDIIREKDRV